MEIRVTADILENETGDFMLAFHTVEGEPETPFFIINGDDALLKRNSNQKIMIGRVHPDVKERLSNASKILVSEVGPQGIVNGYFAPVNKM